MKREFHPHLFPQYKKCIRLIPAERDSLELHEGSTFHDLEFVFWESIQKGKEIGKLLESFPEMVRPKLNWSYQEFAVKRELKIEAVEEELPIVDQYGEQICLAHLDTRFSDARGLPYITDWKTGRVRDYSMQLKGYAAATMDKLGVDTCRGAIAYPETGEVHEMKFTYDDVHEIWKLYDAFEAQELPHTINEYCEWCELNGKCPAWLKQADKAIVAADRLTNYLPVEIDKLKSDPIRLEEFLLLFDRLKQMVEDNWQLKDALLAHTDLGYHLEKYTKVTVDPKSEEKLSCNPEEFLLKVAKPMGLARVAVAITVDVAKAMEMWKDFTNEKEFPIKVRAERVEKKGYSYLRRKTK